MRNCEHCMRPLEDLAARSHPQCAEMSTQGMTDAQIMAVVDGNAVAPAGAPGSKPVTAKSIFWAVFLALLAFAVLAGIVSFVISMLNSAAP